MILSFYGNDRFLPYWLAAMFSGLTVLGFCLSPRGTEVGIAVINLWMGIGTLWVVAVMVAKLRHAADETRKLSRAVEQCAISICITDVSGRISYVNPKFSEVTGYTLNEVRGENLRILKFGEMTPEQYEGLSDLINAGKEWRGTCEERKKNGDFYSALSSITPVSNEVGKITNFLSVSEDITERKRTEEALQKSEERYRSLFANMLNGYAYCQVIFEGDEVKDFIYLEVNAAFERLTGLKNVVGRKATEVIPGIRKSDQELLGIFGRVARTGVPEQFETCVQALDIWFSISVYSPADGYFVAVFDVITDRKKAEAALQESEERFRKMVEGAEIAVFLSAEMKFTYLNPAALRLFGAETSEQLVGQPVFSRIHPDYHESVRMSAAGVYSGQWANGSKNERVYLRLDGTPVPVEVSASPFTFHGQRGAAMFVRDISAYKQAEQALLESEAQFRAAFEQAAVGMAQSDLEGHWLRVNNRFCSIIGYSKEELLNKTFRDITHPEDLAGGLNLMRLLLAGELETYTLEKRYFRKDRSIVAVNVTLSLVREASGKPRHFIGVVEDITERKRADAAMRESERNFRNIFECAHDAIITADPSSGRFTAANSATLKMFGAKDEADFLSRTVMDVSPERQPNGRMSADESRKVIEIAMCEGSHSFEWMHQRINGEAFVADVLLTMVRLNGNIRILSTVRDITERKRAETALRESEERFREIAESIEEVFWVTDPVMSRILYVSPAYERIWGQTCQHLYDEPHSWVDTIHHEDRARVLKALERQVIPGAYNEDYRIVRPDGQIRWIHDKAFPVRGTAGKVRRVVGMARDVTDRRQLEEQFRQSQKMEAIGQLAGGVAHDFNNILCAMMMRSELAQLSENLPEETRDALREIRTYAERAANLTRQLLLFSRRQVMQPTDLDLNDVVTNIAKMLQRMIGEDVRLQLHLNPAPIMVHADAGMLDQVLMNLAVNSRDAMPKGGRLLIETAEEFVEEYAAEVGRDVAPGRYVSLRVTDTGCGIPPEILPRIFEPFFTTKEAGKGTGLGLATIFGIVKQHRGTVNVDSVPGKGTTFHILLPSRVVDRKKLVESTPRPKLGGGTETILLAEDDPTMRGLICLILRKYGYNVLETSHGKEALSVWQKHRGTVAMLVTDLVMPHGMSGQELAQHLRADQPALKVLFMSGYSSEIAGKEFQLQNGEDFLQKPFATDKFLFTIRQCLDEQKFFEGNGRVGASAPFLSVKTLTELQNPLYSNERLGQQIK
ncbi:MAG: PAS domain S-box protein [Verrucomicrobiota bacterium]